MTFMKTKITGIATALTLCFALFTPTNILAAEVGVDAPFADETIGVPVIPSLTPTIGGASSQIENNPLLNLNGFSINAISSPPPNPGIVYHYRINGQTYELGDPSGHSELTPAQQAYVANQCDLRVGSSACASHDITQSQYEDIQEDLTEQAYLDSGGMALKLFSYAMGGANGDGNGCITCAFLGNFMLGLASFSIATFFFFQSAFMTIVPVLMAIWIAWKAASLFVTGGEDGRSFIYAIASKFSLLFFAWAFISLGSPTYGPSPMPHAWNMTGPTYLEYAFDLSSAIRNTTLEAQGNITSFKPGAAADAFKCADTVKYMSQFTQIDTLAQFSASALDVACATERTHMVGFASGLAIIGSTSSQIGISPKSWGTGLVKFTSGFFMLFIFGLSAVWFTFLVLDVVVRGLITAAFLPFIVACYLFVPSRYIAVNAFKSMTGAVMTAVAIGIVSTLAFFLLTNTVQVYNSLAEQLNPIYPSMNLQEIPEDSSINMYREFIVRIQETNENNPQIPMDLTTPWFYYLVLCGLAIFSLGKKIISMLEGMIGTSGMSAMADNAMKLSRTAIGLGMGAGAAATAGTMFATRAATAGAGAAGGFGGEFLKNTISPFGSNASSFPGAGAAGAAQTAIETMSSSAEASGGS